MRILCCFIGLFTVGFATAQIETDSTFTVNGELYITQELNDSTKFTKVLIDSAHTKYLTFKLREEKWELITSRLMKNGITIQTKIFSSNGTGIVQDFANNGALNSIVSLKDGVQHGAYTAFFSSGAVKVSGVYQNQLKLGEWVEYFEDGSIRSIENYTIIPFNAKDYEKYTSEELMMMETNTKGEASLRHGLFIAYNKDGTVSDRREYLHGRLKN